MFHVKHRTKRRIPGRQTLRSKNKIPQRAYEVAIGYCRRLQSAGVSREGIEEIERLMIDERYIKANKRLGRELSEDDLIMLIDRTFDAVREAMSWKGLRV
jgi:hypothetical protein